MRRDGQTFTGWGGRRRTPTATYGFTTLAPGSAKRRATAVLRYHRVRAGLLHRLFTRAYLPDAALDADALLSAVDPRRRATLLCNAESGSGRTQYLFDIHLQGLNETVFLAYGDDRR